MNEYRTPAGEISALYEHITQQAHILIAGTTGSGKSVTVRGILNALLYRPFCDCENGAQLMLIDPKGTELVDFAAAPHCLCYASAASAGGMLSVLRAASNLTDERFQRMQTDPGKMDNRHYYIGSDIWVVIDELADLMLTPAAPEVKKLIQHIGQIGRAARIHFLCCTQCPLVKVIPTEIKVNFDAVLALRTRSAQDSRNIIGVKGAETFPKYGRGLYQNPDDREIVPVNLKYVEPAETARLVEWWREQITPSVLYEVDRVRRLPQNATGRATKPSAPFKHRFTASIGKGLKWVFRIAVASIAAIQVINWI